MDMINKDLTHKDEAGVAAAPIAFFAFNRPEHTHRTLAALAANDLAAETDLYIFCDGPRRPEDEDAVTRVREICRAVAGFASVHIREQRVNQGLANSLIAGISSVFEAYDSVIVFEDDVLASPETLRFLNTCLTRYQMEPVVFNVSAWSPDPAKMDFPEDYPWDVYFIPRLNCWGWATWKDRWQSIDWNIATAPAFFENPYAVRGFSQGGADMPPMLQACLEKQIDSWAVRADFARFAHGRLGLNPVHAYIENIGLDNSGAHCGESARCTVNVGAVPAATRFPEYVFVDDGLRARYKRFFNDNCPVEEQSDSPAFLRPSVDDQDLKAKDRIKSGEAQCLRITQLEEQLAQYADSKVVRGALQLRDIAHRRAWRELPGWGLRVGSFVCKKLRGRYAPGPLDHIERSLAAGNLDAAYKTANELKCKGPLRGLDALRAKIFLQRGEERAAVQALREELRYFPDNKAADDLLRHVAVAAEFPGMENKELDALLATINPYTMVCLDRLVSLYENAKRICASSLGGNFVECGVAAGGTSGLLSAVLLWHDASHARRVYSFDTFSGMPRPTEEDMHCGTGAQDSGWGEGTCAAPQESLRRLAQILGTTHLIHPVKGLFAETLPVARAAIGPIALLHMDGDWYESTRDILHNLYDLLVPGAYVQIDDYGHWDGCRKAVHEFFDARDIRVELHPIDGTGVWFTKPEDQIQQDTAFNKHTKSTLLIHEAIKAKQELNAKTLINLGCGSRWHPNWINIDIHGDNVSVFQHDLRQRLPLPKASADFIYASHCLEHFTRFDVENFLRQCAGALKPLGTLRISVPDLEQITRTYLIELDALRIKPDDAEAIARHNWMITELIDQLCRHQSGGEMLKLWASPEAPPEAFLLQRIGAEYLNARQHIEESKIFPPPTDAQQVGTFRLGGEPHQWMYDEFSLSRLLRQCGFTATLRTDAASSRLGGFAQYCLDTSFDGSIYKPDGLYMEAWFV